MSEANESGDSAPLREGIDLDAVGPARDFFGTVLESMGEAVFVVYPPDRRILMTNRAAGELFGLDAGELVGRSTRLIYRSEEDYRTLARRTEEALERGRAYRGEFPFRRADGEVFRAHVTTTAIDPLDWRGGVVSVLHDVSALREAQERAGHLLAALESRVRKLRCVREAATVLSDHVRPLEVVFQKVADAIPPALADDGAWASISYDDLDISSPTPDGGGQVVEVTFTGLEGRTGTLRAGYVPDEDEEAQLPEVRMLVESVGFLLGGHCKERELRARTERERDRFLRLFRASPVATSLSELATGVFIDVNEKWVEITGYDPEELVGRSSVDLGLWEDPGQRVEIKGRLASESSIEGLRVGFRRKDGTLRQAFGSLQVIELDGRRVLFATLHDITDQLAFEERRARMAEKQVALERLGAIGELAGGVAHDLNNLLLPILVNVELALPDASDELRGQLEEVREAAKRGRDLTRKLLSFSGKQTLRKRRVDLAEMLAGAGPILRKVASGGVSLELEPVGDLPEIHADPSQLELVLINLVGNARDAVDGSGRITVSTSTGPPRQSDTAFGVTDTGGPFVYLHVSDDGCGIPHDVVSRIFEPFFTTKEDLGGTGLGLSSVLGIVEQHGGHIVVDSRVDEGTSFHVGFPALEPAGGAREGPARETEFDENVGAGRSVLVVEDDPAVRRVTARTLRSYGFQVEQAEDGPAALALLESREEDVDVIISDMVMPGMTGLELHEAVRASKPHIPVLFVSGYSWSILADQGIDRQSVNMLEKPFTPRQLIQAVQETLSGSEETP